MHAATRGAARTRRPTGAIAGAGRRRAAGLTLVEIMLGLVLSGMIGMGVAMMMTALSTGTRDQQDTRRTVVKREVVNHRLSALIEEASMVLAVEADHLVLWREDSQHTGEPNLSELRRVDWYADSGEIWVYERDEPGTPDPTYDRTSTDFSAVTAAHKASGGLPGELVAGQVSKWTATVDDEDAVQAARLIRVDVTLEGAATGQVKEVPVVAGLQRPAVD